MKLFMPFDESLMSTSNGHIDQLVPYQVGMSCADWYEIIPLETLDPATPASQRQPTVLEQYCLSSQG